MPAIADIVLQDAAATPVNHTFGVVTTNGAKADWAERSSLTPAGYLGISHEIRKESPTGPKANRVVITGMFPVTQTVNGIPTVTRYNSAKVELNFAQESTDQERKDVLAYMTNFLSNANVKTSVQILQPFY